MKKILLSVLMGLSCSSVFAQQNVRELASALGYTAYEIYQNLPKETKYEGKRILRAKDTRKAANKSARQSYNANESTRPSYSANKSARQSYSANESARQSYSANESAGQSYSANESSRPSYDADELLKPRVFDSAESAALIPALIRYHKKNPSSDKLTRKLAVTCLSSGQYKEALYWYTLTYQRKRSDYASLWNMAALAYEIGDYGLTEKYLKEYARVDPNSAWGRMARDFLSGRFSGKDMSSAFQNTSPRVGSAVKASSPQNENGILVIEGKRTDFGSYMGGFTNAQNAASADLTADDTAKGKIGKHAKAAAKRDRSLKSAAIKPAAK